MDLSLLYHPLLSLCSIWYSFPFLPFLSLKKISKGSSKYAWLYDYTSGCEEYGCNVEDSSNTGYWTNDPITSNSAKVWGVGSQGILGDPYAANIIGGFNTLPSPIGRTRHKINRYRGSEPHY